MRLEHVGIGALGLDHPVAQLAGLELGEGRLMPSGVRIARDRAIELVTSDQPGNPIERFLERSGPGLHHLALGVPSDLNAIERRLVAAGVEVVGPIEPGSDGRRTLFLHPRSMGGVLVELVEVVA